MQMPVGFHFPVEDFWVLGLLAIVNNAAINMARDCLLEAPLFFCGFFPSMEPWGHVVVIIWFLEPPTVSFVVLFIPPAAVEEVQLCCILAAVLAVLSLFLSSSHVTVVSTILIALNLVLQLVTSLLSSCYRCRTFIQVHCLYSSWFLIFGGGPEL